MGRKMTPEGQRVREMIARGCHSTLIVQEVFPELTGEERDKKEASIRAIRSQLQFAASHPRNAHRGELVRLAQPAQSVQPASLGRLELVDDHEEVQPPPAAAPTPTPRAQHQPPRPAEYVHQSRIVYLEKTIVKLEQNADLSTGDQTTRALKTAADMHKELDKLRSERDGKTVTDPALAEQALADMLPQMSDTYIKRAVEEYLRRNPSLTVQVA